MTKYLAVAVCVGLALAADGARAQPTSSADSLTERNALKVMRVVMSAQANEPFRQSGFGSLAELMAQAPLMKNAEPQFTLINSVSASVLDYTLRIDRSDDKRHYAVSLTPTKGCG